MNRSIILTLFVLLFFSTAFNPALTHASFNEAPDGYPKSAVANSSTIWVPDNHTRIQWAINNASDGDTIIVRAGTYYEPVVVDKALSLIGENKHDTIIDGNRTGTAVHIISNNITVSNFTIQNAELGIWLWYSKDNVLTNNTISHSSYGVLLSYSSGNVLSGNTASKNWQGIYLSYSSNNIIHSNNASHNWCGINLYKSSDNTLTDNTVSHNWDGFYLDGSDYNTFTGNTASNNSRGFYLSMSGSNAFTGVTALNNSYGFYLWRSGSNAFTGVTALYNSYGFYLSYSSGTVLSDNTASDNQNGFHLDSSDLNTLTGNTVSLNNNDGIRLYHSNNNALSSNTASNNSYGIYVEDSDNNDLSGNTASNNQNGIYLYYSRDNILTRNVVTNNSQYGIRLSSSINNIIFHNNFINNTEPTSSIESVNTWDNGVEGNYWSDYDGTDANRDGIGDTPYPIDENIQDNYPLMATFLQFKTATEKQYFTIDVVCNFTIINFQYRYDPKRKINAVSFKVNGTEGKGFCRITIPHALIEPPYTVTVNHNQPSYLKIVYTHGMHTCLYFTYDQSEHEVVIMHTPYPEQLLISQWAIFGLTVVIVILLSISINYYRKFNKQRKIVQEYERELGSLSVSHSERARTRFLKDVIERKEKIENFKIKYGIKIQPATTLEDLMEKLGVQKES